MDGLLCYAAIITISNILICIWGDTKSLIYHVVSAPDIYCHIASVYTWQFGILKMHKMHIMGFAKEGMHSCIPALYVAPCLHVAEETFVFSMMPQRFATIIADSHATFETTSFVVGEIFLPLKQLTTQNKISPLAAGFLWYKNNCGAGVGGWHKEE